MKKKNKIEEYSSSSQNFKYSGDITIKITDDDNRVYSETKYHNTGCLKLFNFFADCLIGNYNIAKSNRPCRVVLFKEDDDHPTYRKVGGVDKFDITSMCEECRVSTRVYYDSTPEPNITENDGCSVKYHFRLPFLTLANGAIVKKIGLYPNIISSYTKDLCAYFILPEGKEIPVPEAGGNYTIIIDWILIIENK